MDGLDTVAHVCCCVGCVPLQLGKCAQDLGSTSKAVGSSMAQLLTCAAQGNEHYTGEGSVGQSQLCTDCFFCFFCVLFFCCPVLYNSLYCNAFVLLNCRTVEDKCTGDSRHTVPSVNRRSVFPVSWLGGVNPGGPRYPSQSQAQLVLAGEGRGDSE